MMELLAEFFLKYWALLIFVGGIVTSGALFKYQQKLNVKDICIIKENKEKEALVFAGIQDRLGNIETSMAYLKDSMKDLNNFLQLLLKQELKH